MSNPELTREVCERMEMWECRNCINRCLFGGEPDIDCWGCGSADWEQSVLAARRPRSGHWGVIECSNCSHEFVEKNDERVTGWVCGGCNKTISCYTQRPKIENVTDSPAETEQIQLPIATDGGQTEIAGKEDS